MYICALYNLYVHVCAVFPFDCVHFHPSSSLPWPALPSPPSYLPPPSFPVLHLVLSNLPPLPSSQSCRWPSCGEARWGRCGQPSSKVQRYASMNAYRAVYMYTCTWTFASSVNISVYIVCGRNMYMYTCTMYTIISEAWRSVKDLSVATDVQVQCTVDTCTCTCKYILY